MKSWWFLGAAGAALAAAGHAGAQTSDAGNTVQELVVTAEKREANLQKVSVAVTALTGDELKERNIVNPRELIYMSPALQLPSNNINSAEGFAVRGVGTSAYGFVQQAVASVRDGVAVDPSSRTGLMDIERVEVLRGPQGMLFGRNSSAGLINFVTKRPVLGDFAGELYASYAESDEFPVTELQGVLNVPVTDTTAIRLNAYYTKRGGFLQNLVDGRDINYYEDWGLKGKFLWQPSDDFSAYLIVEHAQQSDPFRVAAIIDTESGSILDQTFAQYGVTPDARNTRTIIDGPNYGNFKSTAGTLILNYALGRHSLTATTYYTLNTTIGEQDTDSGPLPLFDVLTDASSRTYSQELKLTSPAGERLEYVAGIYLDRQTVVSATRVGGKLTPALISLPISFSFTSIPSFRAESIAAYGQAKYTIVDGWRLIAGGRLTHDQVKFAYTSFNAPGPGIIPFPGFAVLDGYRERKEKDNLSWKIGLEHDLSPDVMGYATVTRGYKGPGYNVSGVDITFSQYVRPEIPTNYELGLKALLFDRRMRLNLAAYKADFKDYQAQLTDVSGAVPKVITANAGRLKTHGFEAEMEWRPVDGLSLNSGLAYTRAKYGHFIVACYPGQPSPPCDPVLSVVNAKGNPLINAPKWTFFGAARYERDLTADLKAVLRGDLYWRSESTFSIAGNPRARYPDYALLGLSAGIEDAGGRWSLSVWGKNLTDEPFPGAVNPIVGGGFYPDIFGLSVYRSHDSFRTIGATLQTRF